MKALRLIAVAFLLISATANAGTPLPDAPHVVANGRGKIVIQPDMVRLNVAASIKDPSSASAKASVDQAVSAFMAAMAKFGVKPEDITASALSVREDYALNTQGLSRPSGFVANRSLSLKLHDLDKLDAVMNAALKAGMTRVEEPKFSHSRMDALRADARQHASRRVTENATTLATAFNARLGAVYSINSVSPEPFARYGATSNAPSGGFNTVSVAASGAPALIPEIEIEESMTAVYLLQP